MVPFLWRRGAKREPGRAKHQEWVVRSTSDNRWLEPTTPSAPAKEASRHFLSGRSHPSLSKEGTSAFPFSCFQCPRRVQQKMWDMASLRGGEKRLSQFAFSQRALSELANLVAQA